MQRYKVTVVAPGTTDARPVLLVPFQPDALVTAFIDELYRRITRQGLAISPNTHIATLHLDSETGALIDAEDLISHVITNPKSEQIVTVFSKKDSIQPAASAPGDLGATTIKSKAEDDVPGLSIRLVTPATANDKQDCPILPVPLSATVKQLHERIAAKLEQAPNFDQHADSLECNCSWANHLSTISTPRNTMLVVSGKSVVQSVTIATPTEAGAKAALRQHLGQDYELTKRLALVGANTDINIPTIYKKVPVAAICSRQRHTPVHARVDIDETGHRRSKVIDLHTAEIPISPACMDATLEEVGFAGLYQAGAIDIYAVSRTTTGQNAQAIGKSSVFRARAHWEPRVVQSDRGMAMFLSSLRVFASLVQEMGEDDRSQDAVLHAFDLLTNFPPALRTLHILVQGKTPTAVESAAFSAAMFQALDSFAPNDIIGTDQSRVFEVSRLFLGFVLEKARTLKLPEDSGAELPYLSSVQTVDLADLKTGEAVMRAVQTSQGVMEATVFNAFQHGGILSGSHLSSLMTKLDINADLARLALLNGGTATTVTALSKIRNYRYRDNGDVNAAIDLGELSELSHLAELCGRNKLAVHRPSQLSSAVTPCLTFDRNAHLAVYAGEQPCGDPGHSSILFRPQHGDETIDSAVIEQLIAPILQSYEADGTAVFDSLGGAAVRRLQAPEEILMFCVDCSASMREPTDFDDVNDDTPFANPGADIQSYVDAEFYNRASYDDMKEYLCQYQGFNDIVAIVGDAAEHEISHTMRQVLEVLRGMLSTEIIKKANDITAKQSNRNRYVPRNQINALVAELDKIKAFWAGLKTHEETIHDFIRYRATSQASDISQRWTWSIGDELPASGTIHNIPELPSDVTDLPDNLRCPISHTLMEEAVNVSDGHIYCTSAIQQWFSIRKSSPMTGLGLADTTLTPNVSISDAAASWAAGDGIVVDRDSPDQQPAKRPRSEDLEITFESRLGSFKRKISPNLTLKQLYMLAFRGLKARAMVFQLTTERYGILTPTPEAVVSSRNIRDGEHITIRIAEDAPIGVDAVGTSRSHDQVLVKLYENTGEMLFGYWVKRDTPQTMASVLWKYWRYMFASRRHVSTQEKQVWADMIHSGDRLMRGNPTNNTEMLATYLSGAHCFGHLGEEKVYQEKEHLFTTINQPLVLKLLIHPPYQPRRERSQLTRLGVLKQIFEAVVNRMLAYNYNTHCGLITFASSPKLEMKISHVMENFRRATQDMKANGDTSLWDALALGKDQLVEYGKKYPDAKKRIICISDGDDTKSVTNKANEICYRLREAKIAVDTIALGNEDNDDLHTISYLLGGYTLHPTSLINALAITEMEPFLALAERPPVNAPVTPAHRLQFMGHFWKVQPRVRYTVVTADQVPPRKEHPNLHDDFVQVNAMATRPHSKTNTGNRRSNLRTSRLLIEMRSMAAEGSHPKYDVYVSESDMCFWKVVMEGPDDSPYTEGTFVLYIHADEGYPTFAPKARFITKIKHPNVNAHGRICHSILTRDWTSDIKMTTLIDSIYGLLLQPEHSDPVSTIATLGFHHDQVEFADEVRGHVEMYASRGREQWKKVLLGEIDEDEEEGYDDDDDDEDEDMDSEDDDEDDDMDGEE